MSAKTNFLETALLNHILRGITYSSPAGIHLGLFTAAPGEAGGGTEVSGNGYARQSVSFGAPVNGASTNTNVVTFPTATPSGWGVVTHFALFDAASGGNMLYYGALTQPRDIQPNDSAVFQVGQVTISED